MILYIRLLNGDDFYAKDGYIQAVLGEDLARKYIQAKEKEYADYRAQVTEWEIGRYLHRM